MSGRRRRAHTPGVWEGVADSVRRDVAALARSGLGVTQLHAAAIALVERVVPCDLTCWASLDPDSAAISSMTSGVTRIPQQYEPLLANYEYDSDEPNTFAQLARRPEVVARLAGVTRSGRFNEVWRPLGLRAELRAMFHVDGTCWGAAGMVRSTEFTDREAEFMASVAPVLAAATRVAARAHGHGGGETAILVVGGNGVPRAVTASAKQWQDELDAIASGRFLVMVRAVAAGARASGSFRARVRDASGGWILFRASTLLSGSAGSAATGETVVTVERASGTHLLGVLLAAYGLTARERDICREVIAGRSTSDIAARLDISAHTVQDHLKSVFGKVGVRSRGELVAELVT